ncbi:DUF317 domain-containing protein [Streptomyces achromogenes]|uniref:DUF317 domain-containing protein n=1 Tax=Streptomyces achromogenes TaxID=67255 RepID=UPI00358EF131
MGRRALPRARWPSGDGVRSPATSPDRLTRLEYRPPSSFGRHTVARDEAWRARILAIPYTRRALWEADFHSATLPVWSRPSPRLWLIRRRSPVNAPWCRASTTPTCAR